jgi:hypothetical protein
VEDVELRVIDQALAEELFFERSSGRIKESRKLYAFPSGVRSPARCRDQTESIQRSPHPLTFPAQ